MKTKKSIKKVANCILKKKVNSFDFFTVEYGSKKADYFFKKNNTSMFKHPLKLNHFETFNRLKHYVDKKNINIIYIFVKNIYTKHNIIKNLYFETDVVINILFKHAKKIYLFWTII